MDQETISDKSVSRKTSSGSLRESAQEEQINSIQGRSLRAMTSLILLFASICIQRVNFIWNSWRRADISHRQFWQDGLTRAAGFL